MKPSTAFTILILGVWLLACVACFATKNSDPVVLAAVFSCVAGFGYFMIISD